MVSIASVLLITCGIIFLFSDVAISKSPDPEDHSLLWLTRPNVYFGARARTPKSPLVGIMWTNADKPRAYDHIRHDCDERDKFARYGWLRHDGRNFGVQELADQFSGVNITTEWVKYKEEDGSENWAARITGEPMKDKPAKRNIMLMWYVAAQGSGHSLSVPGGPDTLTGGSVAIQGSGSDIGEYTVVFRDSEENRHPTVRVPYHTEKRVTKHLKSARYAGVRKTEPDSVWRTKDIAREMLIADEQKAFQTYWPWVQHKIGDRKQPRYDDFPHITPLLPNSMEPSSNVVLVQKVFTLPFKFDLIFASKHIGREDIEDPEVLPDSARISALINAASERFTARFERVFGLDARGLSVESQKVAMAALSNMLGGIGYFHGTSQIRPRKFKKTFSENGEPEEPPVEWLPARSLYASVPSRSFFPRGFYWDEGFHQLLIAKWDASIAQEAIRSWYNLMDADGWIGREQILGEEARSRVPAEFQVQVPDVANPPTIILALHQIIEAQRDGCETEINADGSQKTGDSFSKCSATSASWNDFLAEIYPNIKRHVEWYFRTQVAKHDKSAFMWRGCTAKGCLPSGLDDSPRPSTKKFIYQGHVDLHSWMVTLAQTMAEMAQIAGEPSDYDYFSSKAAELLESLNDHHWDESKKRYADYGVNPKTKSREYIHHSGYIGLFPFLLGLIPHDDPKLGSILDFLEEGSADTSRGIWSNFGLRSLAVSDSAYATGENYWRGPIWININYLAVRALHHYGHPQVTNHADESSQAPHAARARELYVKLRRAILRNVVRQYRKTGFLWEQYHPESGAGQRSHPFTGWTALIVNIMGEKY
eukprot:475223_1